MESSTYQKKFRTAKLMEYSKKTWTTLAFGLLLSMLAVLTDLAGPYIISKLLDGELVEGIGPKNPSFYFLLLGVFLVTIILASIFRYLNVYYFNKTANKVAMFMQEDVFRHVQKMPIPFFDKLPAGKVVSRITNDTKDVRVLFQVVLSQLITAFVYATGIFISLALIDYKLALMALVPMPFVAIIFVDFKNKSKKYNYAYRRYLSDLNANLNENIQGIEIIHAFNREDRIYEEFDEVNNNVYKEGLNFTKLFAYSGFNAMGTLQFLSLAGALLFFGYGSIIKAYPVTVGMLYIFIDYMTKIFDHLTNVVLRVGELEKARGAADHVFELLHMEAIEYGGEKCDEINGVVDYNDVSFAYNDEDYVLSNVSFKVNEGESAAFVGHTGSGKSTIMNLLLGYYKPQSGSITIDGVDLNKVDLRELRKHMSIVLQDPYLFTGDLKSNITLFDDSISDEDAEKALREVGGAGLLNKHSDGIKTEVKEKGSTFSAGERQLISFARALVRDPKILVLDEATSNIDSETEEFIQTGIERLKRGRTTFIIAHRLSTIKNVDTIYVLDKGRIVESGSHDELIEKGGIYRRMYLAQSSKF
ncbi:ABC transporter ATP-binding protein [Microaceticoccus formicicus]|uniref:ABC transporter ATP-binding protein n=1 Tax=Microaceticoccus formicicus TaxID=3118105 RepID=UPI003CD03FF4|nr:ABC transporter ATP-binding protein [Peptoniphilaceae bacterium AMB_02]